MKIIVTGIKKKFLQNVPNHNIMILITIIYNNNNNNNNNINNHSKLQQNSQGTFSIPGSI